MEPHQQLSLRCVSLTRVAPLHKARPFGDGLLFCGYYNAECDAVFVLKDRTNTHASLRLNTSFFTCIALNRTKCNAVCVKNFPLRYLGHWKYKDA